MSNNNEADLQAMQEVRKAARHFAMLYFHFCHSIVEAVGSEAALPIVQKAVFKLALERTDLTRAKAQEAGAELNLINFSAFSDLPTVGWSAWDASMGGVRCPYAQQWALYFDAHPWFRQFASLYCDVIDTTTIENFSRTLSHRITKNLVWGDATCEHEYYESDDVKKGKLTYGKREG